MPDDDTISLMDLILVLAKHLRLIIGITSLVALVVFSYLMASKLLPTAQSPMPDVYTANATLLIESSSGGIASQIPSELARFAGNLDFSDDGTNNRELAVRLLNSRGVLDSVAEELNLDQRLQLEEPTRRRYRDYLRDKIQTESDNSTGAIQISFTDTDPEFAAAAIAVLIEQVENRFTELGVDQNQLKAELLDERLSEVSSRIEELETRIEDFQQTHGILSTDSVAQQQTQLLGELRSQLVLTELELDYSSEFTSANSLEMQRMQARRDSYQELIQNLEGGEQSVAIDSLGFRSAELPGLIFEFERLTRELDVQSAIYRSLSQEAEVTRLSSMSRAPVFQILEAPEVPEQKSGPSRAMTAIIATITAFFLSVFLAFVLEYIHRVQQDPEEGEKLSAVKRSIHDSLVFWK